MPHVLHQGARCTPYSTGHAFKKPTFNRQAGVQAALCSPLIWLWMHQQHRPVTIANSLILQASLLPSPAVLARHLSIHRAGGCWPSVTALASRRATRSAGMPLRRLYEAILQGKHEGIHQIRQHWKQAHPPTLLATLSASCEYEQSQQHSSCSRGALARAKLSRNAQTKRQATVTTALGMGS